MSDIVIRSQSHRYHIYIGEKLRFQLAKFLPKKYSSILIITDDRVADLYLEEIKTNFTDHPRVFEAIIPAGEQSKSIDQYYKLQTKAIESNLDRNSLIIALGGGVVGDIAGFVAATFMRGIDYVQIPTTILAHDSSVGGKVAINHEKGKNLIGNFYPPRAVIYDVDTLQTLGNHEIRSGYAELVKEALISDVAFFNDIMQIHLSKLSNEQLQDHLRKGIFVKAKIVEEDEKEAGSRMFLNLGHTLGHALEATFGYGKLTHGEAIAIGLIFALQVSEKIFSIKLPHQELFQWLKENHYPLHLPQLDVHSLLDMMKRDKKAMNHQIKMVLLKEIGEPIAIEIDDKVLEPYLNDFIGEMSTN